MIVSRLILKNWRNFRSADVDLGSRVFLLGPNASGKSNFLEVFRFLRDIAKQGGGLQKALSERGGLSKVRCLGARRYPNVEIEVHLAESEGRPATWRYAVGIKQEARGHRQACLDYERVWKGEKQIVNRPESADLDDPQRLTQTYLEQINANAPFREVARFLESILYLHLVPQVLRHPDSFSGPEISGDPFGRNFLERVARTPGKTRDSRLRRIETALRLAVPQLKDLAFTRDGRGVPHLEAVHRHWRPKAGKQREDQFSDGTLRLIGLLWSLLEGDSPLLLEEPELSLHSAIVTQLPPMIHRIQRQKRRQILISTHSPDLLSDRGIGGGEALLLIPGAEGTEVALATSLREVRDLLDAGLSIADAALPHTAHPEMKQLSFLE
ncbi:MAG: AAA family ATPase [Candidatus Solibacter usitatus]|nr:AAA family ATPase [Candidatus Solibacter usitatus]